MLRHAELQLRNFLAVGIVYGAVDDGGNVEDDVVVVAVSVMVMAEPIARLNVYLYVSAPKCAVNLY